MKNTLETNSGGAAMVAVAIGAVAVGALAIGALAIRRMFIGEARIKSLHVEELSVTWLRVSDAVVSESLRLPGSSTHGSKELVSGGARVVEGSRETLRRWTGCTWLLNACKN